MFVKEKLYFAYDDFAKLSAESFEVHYEEHHTAYVENLNKLVKENNIKIFDLISLIKFAFLNKQFNAIFQKIYNNAAQHFNHAFFWKSLTPKVTSQSENLINLINKSFESNENLKKEFIRTGLSLFGSGWIWLVFNKITGLLEIISTNNADTPIVYDCIVPLLICDLWEHSYYIDFLNKKEDYLNIIYIYLNWDFASKNLENI